MTRPLRPEPNKVFSVIYGTVVAVFILFGVAAIFSLGLPFLVLGLAMAFMWPWRATRPPAFYGVLGGLAAFFLVAVLVVPLGCTTTAVSIKADPLCPRT